jgi:signal transduction histidine kinase
VAENVNATTGERRPRRRVFRRVDLRLTIWFTLIFLVSALLLSGFTYVRLYQTLLTEERRQLQSRAIGYVLRFSASTSEAAGINILVRELSEDLSEPTYPPFFARIAAADNHQIFLAIPLLDWQEIDLSALTAGPVAHADGFLSIPAAGFGYGLEVLGIRLTENYVLQIGGDTRNRVTALTAFQTGFFFTVVIMLGLSVAAGLFFVSRSLRPISALNTTVRSIISTGQLDRRIPTRQSNDDLDEMIGSVNLMLDRIQHLVEGLRDALDAVAHDLRTPLTRFRGIAERALSGSPDPDAYAEALGSALEESEHILGMLNSMMDISEAESGAMTLHRQPVDLLALAGDVAEVYGLLAEEADMQIEVVAGEQLVVHADPARMRQVVGNLLDNAIKYGRDGSMIRVSGSADPGVGVAHLSVTNSGETIPAGELNRIWNRLYRAHGAADRRDGLGLGLALVRAIVEAHGGTATVTSADGETVFSIHLPASENITEL